MLFTEEARRAVMRWFYCRSHYLVFQPCIWKLGQPRVTDSNWKVKNVSVLYPPLVADIVPLQLVHRWLKTSGRGMQSVARL